MMSSLMPLTTLYCHSNTGHDDTDTFKDLLDRIKGLLAALLSSSQISTYPSVAARVINAFSMIAYLEMSANGP